MTARETKYHPPCSDFLKGYCRRGANCVWPHDSLGWTSYECDHADCPRRIDVRKVSEGAVPLCARHYSDSRLAKGETWRVCAGNSEIHVGCGLKRWIHVDAQFCKTCQHTRRQRILDWKARTGYYEGVLNVVAQPVSEAKTAAKGQKIVVEHKTPKVTPELSSSAIDHARLPEAKPRPRSVMVQSGQADFDVPAKPKPRSRRAREKKAAAKIARVPGLAMTKAFSSPAVSPEEEEKEVKAAAPSTVVAVSALPSSAALATAEEKSGQPTPETFKVAEVDPEKISSALDHLDKAIAILELELEKVSGAHAMSTPYRELKLARHQFTRCRSPAPSLPASGA